MHEKHAKTSIICTAIFPVCTIYYRICHNHYNIRIILLFEKMFKLEATLIYIIWSCYSYRYNIYPSSNVWLTNLLYSCLQCHWGTTFSQIQSMDHSSEALRVAKKCAAFLTFESLFKGSTLIFPENMKLHHLRGSRDELYNLLH